jgi:hypothetical protein
MALLDLAPTGTRTRALARRAVERRVLQSQRPWQILTLGKRGRIAATALEHDLTVVTRNVSDFEPTGVPVLNPFDPRLHRKK